MLEKQLEFDFMKEVNKVNFRQGLKEGIKEAIYPFAVLGATASVGYVIVEMYNLFGKYITN